MSQALHILTVDDEPSVVTSVSFALGGRNRKLESAGNGEEALARIAKPPPVDVVVTDDNMPRLSGLELVQRLRADGFRGKIVVLSAYLTEEKKQAYRDLQVDGMVEKPFDVGKLRAVVDSLVQAA